MKIFLGLSTPIPTLFQDLPATFHILFSDRHVVTQYHLLRQDIVSKSQASIPQFVMTGHMKSRERIW